MRLLKLILLALGMISLLISLLPLGFASLAFLGVLADVGPAENREMGVQLLSWGLPLHRRCRVMCSRSPGTRHKSPSYTRSAEHSFQ